MFNRRLQQSEEEQREAQQQAEAERLRQEQRLAQAQAQKEHERQILTNAIAQQDARYNQVLSFLNDEFRPGMDQVYELFRENQRQRARTTWKENRPRVSNSYQLLIEPVIYGQDFQYTAQWYNQEYDDSQWWKDFYPHGIAFRIKATTNTDLDITSLGLPDGQHKGAGYTMFASLTGQVGVEHIWYMSDATPSLGKRKIISWKVEHRSLESMINALVVSATWFKKENAQLAVKPDHK